MHKDLIYTVEIPEGVKVKLDGKTLIVNGKRGENKRSFHYPKVGLKIEGDNIVLSCESATKSEKSIMGVFSAHITNMLKGVKDGFTYKLKICSGHFPMSAEVKGNKIIISNFLGEKITYYNFIAFNFCTHREMPRAYFQFICEAILYSL